MLLSNKYKFIFLRNVKTASASLQLFFGSYCNEPDDIISAMGFTSEVYTIPESLKKIVDEHNRKAVSRKNPGCRGHAKWKEVVSAVGEEKWNEYFKFCFVRNPWAAGVSSYWDRGWFLPFNDWIEIGGLSDIDNKERYVDEEDNIVVDYVGKVESIIKDTKKIMDILGLPGDANDLKKIRFNRGLKNRKIHYSYYYDKENQEIVRDRYEWRIKKFNYKFESGEQPKDKIILNCCFGLSAELLLYQIKKITSLLEYNCQLNPIPGYINITVGKDPESLIKKYPDYKIINLIPTLFQDYYDYGLEYTETENEDIDFTNIRNVKHRIEHENILNIDSYHFRKAQRAVAYLIADFLDIPIQDNFVTYFYRSKSEVERKVFLKYFMEKQIIMKDKYPHRDKAFYILENVGYEDGVFF